MNIDQALHQINSRYHTLLKRLGDNPMTEVNEETKPSDHISDVSDSKVEVDPDLTPEDVGEAVETLLVIHDKHRPGWKTTEFWMTLGALILSLLLGSGILTPESADVAATIVGGVVAVAASIGYISSRTVIKRGDQKNMPPYGEDYEEDG